MTPSHTKNTIVFPIRGKRVLLGMKKRGFGEGWWNGFGGKLEPGENYQTSAKRETMEEVGLQVGSLRLVAQLLFYFNNQFSIACEAYTTTEFSGTPKESEEMRPQWFDVDDLPFDTMWPGDEHWIPKALALEPGETAIQMSLYFNAANKFERYSQPDPEIFAEVFTVNH